MSYTVRYVGSRKERLRQACQDAIDYLPLEDMQKLVGFLTTVKHDNLKVRQKVNMAYLACEFSGLRGLPAKAIIKKVWSCTKSSAQKWEVWVEGYAATGEEGRATRLGTATAPTFKDACDEVMKKIGGTNYYDSTRLTYWGCRLFPTLDEARKLYG